MLTQGTTREEYMDAQDCLDMLRDIRDVTFATVGEDGLPQARIIDVMLVERGRLWFCTARGKEFYAQLMHSPHVAITGLSKDWRFVRLSGVVRRADDASQRAWIDRIFDENPSMCGVYPGDSRYILEAFCIEEGTIELFDLGHEPIFRQGFSLGGAVPHASGFAIGDDCIGCGLCARGCPQQCVEKGSPYAIEQEHCLHCGRCFERCPVQAIRRR